MIYWSKIYGFSLLIPTSVSSEELTRGFPWEIEYKT